MAEISNSIPARDYRREEENRQIVLKIFSETDFQKNLDKLPDDYIQHNPMIADGKAGAVAFFKDLIGQYPTQRAHVARCVAEGDMVWVHAHLVRYPGDLGIALVDIFRLKDGIVVEHWDVMQPVPENSANNNTMF